jgi:hypothetical protein
VSSFLKRARSGGAQALLGHSLMGGQASTPSSLECRSAQNVRKTTRPVASNGSDVRSIVGHLECREWSVYIYIR